MKKIKKRAVRNFRIVWCLSLILSLSFTVCLDAYSYNELLNNTPHTPTHSQTSMYSRRLRCSPVIRFGKRQTIILRITSMIIDTTLSRGLSLWKAGKIYTLAPSHTIHGVLATRGERVKGLKWMGFWKLSWNQSIVFGPESVRRSTWIQGTTRVSGSLFDFIGPCERTWARTTVLFV